MNAICCALKPILSIHIHTFNNYLSRETSQRQGKGDAIGNFRKGEPGKEKTFEMKIRTIVNKKIILK